MDQYDNFIIVMDCILITQFLIPSVSLADRIIEDFIIQSAVLLMETLGIFKGLIF